MTTKLATLTEEDLGRWRMAQARMHAIVRKPDGFSVNEIEQAYIGTARLFGEFCNSYGIDDTLNWVVSCNTGAVYYSD